ncbi:MAG: leucine-rich repeat protein [Clostridia bacterium]|nr:leucine-rich repeat protein [Clostridia bacterium]
MKKLKKLSAIIMAVVMVLAAAPLSGFAGIELPELFSFTASAEAASGTFGTDNALTWAVDTETGVLTISGEGAMTDYSAASETPWYSYAGLIKSVVIEEGVTTVADYAFKGTALTEVVLPYNLAEVSSSAFGDCYSLTTVTFTGTQEEWDALDVQFPDSTPEVICAGKSGTTGSNATWRFNGVTGEFTVSGTGTMTYYTTSNPAPWTDFRDEIVTVTIEEGVKNVSSQSFYRCTSLKNVNLPDTVTTIGGCAFEKTSIESIVIPDSVTHIDNAAFRGCKLLENVKLSANLRTIELFAFDDCESLTSLTIPASVTSIVCSFKSCSSLTEIIVEEGNTNYVSDEYGVLYTASFAALKSYPVASVRESYTVNEATETIAKNAFSYNENLKTVILPEGVEKIQGDAFYSCKMLETVVIPTTVTTIGTETDAFGDCTSLKNVTYNGSEHDWMLIYDNELQNLDGVTYNFLSQAENNGHTYELITDIEPTETQHGEKAYSCSCGMSYSELLHNYIVDPNMPEVPPTCNSNGKRYYICTVCGDEEAEMLEKTGEHKHVMNRITKMPTATTRGVKEGSCIYCGSVKGERIEATGFEWDESMIIDFLTYTVTGLNPGMTSFDEITNIVKVNHTWTYEMPYSKLGTGSKAILMNENEAVQEYTILIYGDINGDGWYDGEDAFLVNLIVNGMLSSNDVSEYAWRAADCNHDGIINELDVDLLTGAGLLLNRVNQNGTPEELEENALYIEYMGLIDQSFTPDIAPEADGTTDDYNEGDGTNGSVTGIEAIIASFFEFFKHIFSFVLLFIIK